MCQEFHRKTETPLEPSKKTGNQMIDLRKVANHGARQSFHEDSCHLLGTQLDVVAVYCAVVPSSSTGASLGMELLGGLKFQA